MLRAMLKFYRPRAKLLCLASVITLASSACKPPSDPHSAVQPVSVANPAALKPAAKAVSKSASKSTAAPKPSENYQLALDKAGAAQSISQSAQSPDDWELVVNRWEQAVTLLKKVPVNDPNKKLVGPKLTEYETSLATTRSQAERSRQGLVTTLDAPVGNVPLTVANPTRGGEAINQARIKYRDSRIPVIEVLFNGRQSFDMMVDTGASGTMITADMAEALNIEIIGAATAMTPAGPTEVDIGLVKSMRVGNRLVRNTQVLIGPVRLLGHDFFGNCDLTIRQTVVEFGQCG